MSIRRLGLGMTVLMLFAGIAFLQAAKTMTLSSNAFEDGGTIPRAYTCEGKDISPPLDWTDVPKAAQSLALVCDDPDAPGGSWVHWAAYDLSPVMTGLSENQPKTKIMTGGARQGKNDFGKLGWNGPCPPPGPLHHYVFALFALDTMSSFEPGLTKAQLLAAIKGHILAEARLTGTYQR